jgi:hypothetical protein
MTHFRKKMCVAVQRTQLWMQRKFGNKITETKNNGKKNTLPARDIT